ncbi:MAG: RNA polymerase sigma factor [Candidatus Dormibacteria bacterium]
MTAATRTTQVPGVRSVDVTRCGPGELALAAEMYRQHYTDVFRYIRARVSSPTEAEDLTADVFCKAVAGLRRYRSVRPSPLPWLYTIAAHRLADHYRAARPSARLDESSQAADPAPDPLDTVISRDLAHWVWEFSKQLPSSQRRALWLRYGEELELREIAVQMGRSVEAVKLLVHRAIRGIRTRLSSGPMGELPPQPLGGPGGPTPTHQGRDRGEKAAVTA